MRFIVAMATFALAGAFQIKPRPSDSSGTSLASNNSAPHPDNQAVDVADVERVRQLFRTCWAPYRKDCFGKDEWAPGGCKQWLDMGLTIVDSLDTLHILGLEDLYQEARYQ